MKPLRTIHFLSLGCAKNRVDSEVMAAFARARGLKLVAEPEDADVIVVSTCGFIESAREESVDAILDMGRHKAEGRCRVLVAAGCLAQRSGAELVAQMPEIDFALGTSHPDRIGRVLDGAAARLDAGGSGHFLQTGRTPRFVERGAPSAYLKIADGCSRRCAFCAIPAIRGQAESRSIRSVVTEARRLARAGVRELVLVAQDTSSYGKDRRDGATLVSLLEALDGVPDIAWIRLLYLYPTAVTDRLLRAVRDLPRVVPYLDVPIQHASGPMLRRMRRGHGPDLLRRLVERARDIIPGVVLRTTVLVGHPGETERDFEELLAFIEEARFDRLGAFRYSDEEGTPSFGTGLAVARAVAYRRLRKVLALQRRISAANNRALRGKAVGVLVEGRADDAGYVLVGRHAGQAPEVDGVTYLTSSGARRGDIVRARVVRTGDHDIVADCEA
ncbi:MAG: 30S ribosomal protein S12 methylthiotransferase RimO [Deltaproteobacteria bacterium]|nr:30S ribosomal protein S12 methylthiotransferase RimO [Deltaproteobacteria bacterium]